MNFLIKKNNSDKIYSAFWWNGLFEEQSIALFNKIEGIIPATTFPYKWFSWNYKATTYSLSKIGIHLEPNSIICVPLDGTLSKNNCLQFNSNEFKYFFDHYTVIVENQLKPEVCVLSHTENPIDVLYLSARQCYYDGCVANFNINDESLENKLKLIKHIYDSGHLSVFEHVYFTFSINNVSRAESHQHVRKRHASYSQQSQRYCGLNNKSFEYIIPPSIISSSRGLFEYLKTMNFISLQYKTIDYHCDILSEDLRFILPNATVTRFVTTINLRSLFELCNERLCSCAQWEIRKVTKLMANEALKILNCKDFEKMFVPKCKKIGYCNEQANRSCGLMPRK